MPDETLTSFDLPPTGERIITPPLDRSRYAYRVAVEGVIRSAYDGRELDAVYRTGADGLFSERHGLLQWGQSPPRLVEESPQAHRYVFAVPAEGAAGVGMRLNIDKLVDRYLIPPSEIRSSLSGSFHVTVFQTSLAPPSPWTTVAFVGVPAAVVIGGAGVVIRRRMALRGLSDDLAACLVRIQGKSRTARSSLGRERGRAQPLADRLTAVGDGAAALIRQIQGLRDSQRLVDQPNLEKETQALRERTFQMKDESSRREAEAALLEKTKALELLSELREAESRSSMRLTKIEAILDSACLSLRATARGPIETRPEESLQRELDAEVKAIREVTREMEEVREMSVGLMGR